MHRIANRPATIVLALVCLLAAMAPPSTFAAGEYAVRLTGTTGSQWSTYGGLPFITTDGRVYSASAAFAQGDYKAWRASVGSGAARIIGGTIATSIETPDPAMQGRVMVGTGGTNTVLYDGGATGTVRRTIPDGPFDWIQFDLRSNAATKTTRAGTNWHDLTFADVTLRDSVAPVIVPVDIPAATTWHGAGTCIGFSVRATDQGGGLARVLVRRTATGAAVTDVTTARTATLRPGPGDQLVGDCVQPAERGHGDTLYTVTAWDVGGNAREYSFSLRADQVAPAISGGPVEGSQLTTSQPSMAFEVADDGAGVASVSATLDGRAVAVQGRGTTMSLDVGTIGIGAHLVAIAAVDGAGNATRIERRFSIGDTTPPTVAIGSPGARGDATTTVSVRAGDDMSGVDATSWSLLVDGEVAAFEASTDQLRAVLGPLADGSHQLEVSVRDRAGNRASVTHAYYVVPAARATPTSADAMAPGRTGISLVDGPRGAVGYGTKASVTLHVARNGAPVGSQIVEVRQGATVAGSGVTDEDGVARVRVAVRKPGNYDAYAVGMGVDPVVTGIRVAPRIVVTTSTPRPQVGSRVVITGRMYPALRGRRVSLEAQVGGVWYPIGRSAAVNANGTFRSYAVAMSRSRVAVRVRIKAVAPWAGAMSNAQMLRPR